MERQRGTKIIQIISLDLIFILIPVLYYYRKNKSIKKSFNELGIKKIEKKELLKKSCALIIGLMAITFIIGITSSLLGANDLNKVNETVVQIITVSPLLMLYYLVVRVFSEEILFRGLLVKKTGVFFSSLIFGLAHFMYGSVIEVIGAFFAGLFLAYFYQKTNNLLPNIIGHMAFNAIGLILVM